MYPSKKHMLPSTGWAGCLQSCCNYIFLQSLYRNSAKKCKSGFGFSLRGNLRPICSPHTPAYDLFPCTVDIQAIVSSHVETVVLLSKGMVDNRKVKVDFSLEDMDLSEFKGKATYEQIKVYVLEQTGLKVSNLYIAQIKKKCGLDVGENFNLSKSENAKQLKCTPEKEEAIMQAFKHFGII